MLILSSSRKDLRGERYDFQSDEVISSDNSVNLALKMVLGDEKFFQKSLYTQMQTIDLSLLDKQSEHLRRGLRVLCTVRWDIFTRIIEGLSEKEALVDFG